MSTQDAPRSTEFVTTTAAWFMYITLTVLAILSIGTMYEPFQHVAQALISYCPAMEQNVVTEARASIRDTCHGFSLIAASSYAMLIIITIIVAYAAIMMRTARQLRYSRYGARCDSHARETEYVLTCLALTLATFVVVFTHPLLQ